MKESIVILRYPGSDWGNDLVCFRLPEKAGARLLDELNFQRADMDAADFDTVQDLADALCTRVAKELGGGWNYVAQAGSIDIRFD